MKKKWYEYLWLAEALYWILGLCNILFAWLGMLFFAIPLVMAIAGGNKAYCNRYCGRGQLLELLGSKLKRSPGRRPPKFLRSRWFRYGFLAFFMTMFGLMLFSTYRVFAGAVDLPPALGMGQGRYGVSMDCAICFWILQRDDDIHRARIAYHGSVSPAVVVCVLPDGNDDTGNLPAQT